MLESIVFSGIELESKNKEYESSAAGREINICITVSIDVRVSLYTDKSTIACEFVSDKYLQFRRGLPRSLVRQEAAEKWTQNRSDTPGSAKGAIVMTTLAERDDVT